MRNRLVKSLILIGSITLLSTGCEEERDPLTPLGSYNLFKNALETGEAGQVWDRMSQASRDFFNEKHEKLVTMNDTITKYLPPTDHLIAQKQAGTVLLKTAKDGRGLFLALFDSKALKEKESEKDWATELGNTGRATFARLPGVDLPKIVVSEDKKTAVVDAPGIQVAMVKGEGEEGEWTVDLIRSGNTVKTNTAWIDANSEALEKTVDDLISEQRQHREELIAKLMGYKS